MACKKAAWKNTCKYNDTRPSPYRRKTGVFLCRFGFVRLAGGDAALYHQFILIVQAIGIG